MQKSLERLFEGFRTAWRDYGDADVMLAATVDRIAHDIKQVHDHRDQRPFHSTGFMYPRFGSFDHGLEYRASWFDCIVADPMMRKFFYQNPKATYEDYDWTPLTAMVDLFHEAGSLLPGDIRKSLRIHDPSNAASYWTALLWSQEDREDHAISIHDCELLDVPNPNDPGMVWLSPFEASMSAIERLTSSASKFASCGW